RDGCVDMLGVVARLEAVSPTKGAIPRRDLARESAQEGRFPLAVVADDGDAFATPNLEPDAPCDYALGIADSYVVAVERGSRPAFDGGDADARGRDRMLDRDRLEALDRLDLRLGARGCRGAHSIASDEFLQVTPPRVDLPVLPFEPSALLGLELEVAFDVAGK